LPAAGLPFFLLPADHLHRKNPELWSLKTEERATMKKKIWTLINLKENGGECAAPDGGGLWNSYHN
jgi:hypothetical protein